MFYHISLYYTLQVNLCISRISLSYNISYTIKVKLTILRSYLFKGILFICSF